MQYVPIKFVSLGIKRLKNNRPFMTVIFLDLFTPPPPQHQGPYCIM